MTFSFFISNIRSFLRTLFDFALFPAYFLFELISFFSFSTASKNSILQAAHRLEKCLTTTPFLSFKGRSTFLVLTSLLTSLPPSLNSLSSSQLTYCLSLIDDYSKRCNDASVTSVRDSTYAYFSQYVSAPTYSPEYRTVTSASFGNEYLKFVESRVSTRYFTNKVPDESLIRSAISTARHTPSACNRQPWRVQLIYDSRRINFFRRIHNGFSASSQNLSCLIVVLYDNSSYKFPIEMHQAFGDASMFSLNLLLSLQSLGMCACPLNANLPLFAKLKLYRTFNIDFKYRIALFIAVGYVDNSILAPLSPKLTVDELII